MPRRNFIEYLDAFAGLAKPSKQMVIPSRFKLRVIRYRISHLCERSEPN
jgi:hypothetical protein